MADIVLKQYKKEFILKNNKFKSTKFDNEDDILNFIDQQQDLIDWRSSFAQEDECPYCKKTSQAVYYWAYEVSGEGKNEYYPAWIEATSGNPDGVVDRELRVYYYECCQS